MEELQRPPRRWAFQRSKARRSGRAPIQWAGRAPLRRTAWPLHWRHAGNGWLRRRRRRHGPPRTDGRIGRHDEPHPTIHLPGRPRRDGRHEPHGARWFAAAHLLAADPRPHRRWRCVRLFVFPELDGSTSIARWVPLPSRAPITGYFAALRPPSPIGRPLHPLQTSVLTPPPRWPPLPSRLPRPSLFASLSLHPSLSHRPHLHWRLERLWLPSFWRRHARTPGL